MYHGDEIVIAVVHFLSPQQHAVCHDWCSSFYVVTDFGFAIMMNP
jgi:hypothetical protein